MADVNTSILTALEAGYHPQEIMDHIKNSEDPTHQEWYSNYSANMADRSKEPSAASIYYNEGTGVTTQEAKPTTNLETKGVSTPVLDKLENMSPAQAAALGIVGYGLVKGPSIYRSLKEQELDKKKFALEERRVKAYEQQVGKQGIVAEPATIFQSSELSPLEEARVNTERAKAEHIQSKIALAERKLALEEARIKAQTEAKATNKTVPYATTTTTKGPILQLTPNASVAPPSSGPMPIAPSVPLNTEVGKAPKEMPMIEQGLANKEINAVAEGRKQEELKPVEPPKKAPKAKTPMPEGWGKGMTWLVNQHGVEGAQDFIDRYNNGQPFSSHNQMEARRQEVTMRPKFSDIPKSVRKERGISTAVVPPLPPSGGGMGVAPRTGGGGRLNETGRPGEEIIHNLNPLKL